MTSTDSKYGAACVAKRIISTAPIAKFATTATPMPGLAASRPRMAARCCSTPLVPTTTCTPCSTQNATLPSTASGRVRSTATSAPASVSVVSGSADPTRATSSNPSAASIAAQAADPIRPDAPRTATLIGRSRHGAGEVPVLVERADDCQRRHVGEQLGRDLGDLVEGY